MILESFHSVLKFQGFNGKRNAWIGYLMVVLQRMLDRRDFRETLHDLGYTLPISQWLIKFGEVVFTRCGGLAALSMDETEPTPPPIADDLPASFSDDNDDVMGMAEDDDNDGSLKDPLLQPPASASRPFEAQDKCFSDRASYMLEVLSAHRSTASAGQLSPEQQAEHLEDRQQVEEVLKECANVSSSLGTVL